MFKLVQKSINKAVAKFHVLNRAGDIVGSVNVPPEEVDTLLRHWSGAVDRPAVAVPAFKLAPMSKAAILRGCL